MMQNKTPRASIYTLGCKVNQYESEAIAEALVKKGFVIVPFEEEAEVAVINTCTVTAESDRKGCQMIRRAAGRENHPFVIVTGCLAQSQAERVAAIPGVSYICGSRNKLSCADAAARYLETGVFPEQPEVCVFDTDSRCFEEMHITRSERTRAYIKIEDGCENRCTYCAIPGARGKVVSREPEAVLAEMRVLAENGYREIVLTGIETASYGADFTGERKGYRLVDLLEEADKIPFVERIRLGSLEPTYMKPETVSRLAALKHLAPHFHLSLQSGADHVLHLMKRKYNMRQLRSILADIREKIPDVMFTTDVMTGFPQETEEDFNETLAFAREARFLHIHVFPYSRRENTPADRMDGQLSNEEKNRRANSLIAEDRKIAAELYRAAAEKGGEVLFLAETLREDGTLVGHTANFMEVHVSGMPTAENGLRSMCRVKIVGAGENFLYGEPTGEQKT